jgi:aldose sugar dehydrogenase
MFFVIILLLSPFISSGFFIPLTNAQSILPSPILSDGLRTFPLVNSSNTITNPYGDPLQQQEREIPFVDPITGGAVNQYLDSPAYQDPYQIPLLPTQTLPDYSLSLEERQLLPQENGVVDVDVTAPETTINSILDGNNVPLQEGGTTTSSTVLLNILGIDDKGVIDFQCELDNSPQQPILCSTNPIAIENLQPGTHLFAISSIDAAGNVDATPAIFSWNVIASDQYLGGQQMPQQLQQQQLPISPLQEQPMLPYQTNISPYMTDVPNPSNNNTTSVNENQQRLHLLPSQRFHAANPILVPPQYSTTEPYQSSLDGQQYYGNISSLQQLPTTSSLFPFQTPSSDSSQQQHRQQILTINDTNTTDESGQSQNLSLFDTQAQDDQLVEIQIPSNSTEEKQAANLALNSSKLAVSPIATTIGNTTNATTQIPSTITTPTLPRATTSTWNNNDTDYQTFATDNNSSNLVASALTEPTVAAMPTLKDTTLQVQTVTTGLNSPTSMAFLGPNDILVLEKNTGMVKRIKDGHVLPQPLLDVNVASESEQGMLGIDVVRITPAYFYVFLYYTKAELDGGTPTANQLVRYILISHPSLGPAQGIMISGRLLMNLPATPGPNHDGGKVVIGPDRNVYTVLGDLNRDTKAENFEEGDNADGTGGILRVTQRGSTVDSGIIGSTHPLNKYFAYGMRNSFGIDFDPVTGKLWDTENGPDSNDEINLVEPGFNSGWEYIMGIAPAGFNFNNLVSFGGKGKYSDPEFVWTDVVAPTAIEFLSSSILGKQYQNDMFVGDFNKGRVYRFDLNSQRTGLLLSGVLTDKIADNDSEARPPIFGEGFGGISDLEVGARDGYLYVLSLGNGALYKILPKAQ